MDGLFTHFKQFFTNITSFNREIRAKQHPIKIIFFGKDINNFNLVFWIVLVLIVYSFFF